MDALVNLAKMLVKGTLLLIGGLMLFGGGLCALAGVANVGKGASWLSVMMWALVIAIVGWGVIQVAKSIKPDAELPTVPPNGQKARTWRFVAVLAAVFLVIQLALAVLQGLLQ
jgi:thiosulfate reductase cytochrome b subunit